MNPTDVQTRRWAVSTRRRGEVLCAGVGVEGLELVVVSAPDAYTEDEYAAWLTDLIGVATETAGCDHDPRPIPPLLHHVLTGLLFSHAELWELAGVRRPCSVAFSASEAEVAFGWVGEAAVELWIDDAPVEGGWVRVRDEQGREARAISISAMRRVRVHLDWSASTEDPEAAGATIEGDWAQAIPLGATEIEPLPAAEVAGPQPDAPGARVGEGRSEPTVTAAEPAPFYETLDVEAEVAEAGEDFAVPAPPPARRGWFRGLLSGLASWWGRRRGRAAASAVGMPTGAPQLQLPSPDSPVSVMGEEIDPHLRRLEWPASETSRDAAPALRAAPPGMQPAGIGAPADELRAAPQAGPSLEAEDSTLLETLSMLESASRHDAARAGRAAVEDAPAGAAPAPVEDVSAGAGAAPGTETGESPAPEMSAARRLFAFLAARDAASPARPSLAPPAVQEPPPPGRTMVVAPVPVQDRPPQAAAEDSTMEGIEATAAESVPDRAREPAGEWRGPAPTRRRLRPAWPSAAQLEPSPPLWSRPWAWAVLLAALFAGGWLVGTLQGPGRQERASPQGLARALRGLGWGGARFDVMVNSRPEGAWIAVDGKDLARRTPASVDLKPGTHEIALSFSDLGRAAYTLRGARGDQLTLDAPLWGSLVVSAADPRLPISVNVDGRALGFAPLALDSVMPGAHEVRFSGPGLVPWGQTVEVRVQQRAEVIARPMSSPATGLLQVRATLADESGTEAINGAEVWIDGEPRGRTPLVLELPRGPHSARIAYGGESAAVQVIDLPGGNQRFANFELGLGADPRRLEPLAQPDHVLYDRPELASASLDGATASEVREMWLHVHTPDGPWRRYPMDLLRSAGGVVGVTVFPVTLFDDQGRTQYYMSAQTQTGDEYFTEIATAQLHAPARSPIPSR